MRIFLPALLGLLMLSPWSVAADDYYLGAAAGKTRMHLPSGEEQAFEALGGAIDTGDSGFKLFGGYQLNPNVGLELSYNELGEATLRDAGGDVVSLKTSSFALAAVGSVPVDSKLRVFGKIGAQLWDTDTKLNGRTLRSDEGGDLLWGLGAALALAENLDLRAEYERFDLDDDGISLLSLGLQLRF